jgi:hypothetical protein
MLSYISPATRASPSSSIARPEDMLFAVSEKMRSRGPAPGSATSRQPTPATHSQSLAAQRADKLRWLAVEAAVLTPARAKKFFKVRRPGGTRLLGPVGASRGVRAQGCQCQTATDDAC